MNATFFAGATTAHDNHGLDPFTYPQLAQLSHSQRTPQKTTLLCLQRQQDLALTFSATFLVTLASSAPFAVLKSFSFWRWPARQHDIPTAALHIFFMYVH